ncbi:Histidinol-phosphate aminotransferase [Buchnera aphidicola (Cinara pseudotaxifoliae)]|uniref:Histidinol-phosphate aminotransferase n=1 Tax=Buchnera aphidicola (Cinara pseudotaxifoliae) TaxID=655384 RepID=A0A451DGB9_9GAMM|nr:histidinol-phosphate transaminase [Buchnera aphidicola]VFP85666.1 Histidinol-phosphate aminotransferase [Buchnera aphidicola (Cinara pseudotaxifoliae)]
MKRLTPHHIYTLQPYQSARRIGLTGRIYLNANESPWSSTIKYQHTNLNRYPEFQSSVLLNKYAQYSNTSINNLLITRGADEGIELLIRAFCVPKNDKIMFFPPTYDMYAVIANIYNIKKKIIPILSNFQLDLINIKKYINNVKLIYICNPNNPTGNFFLKKDIISILDMIPQTTLLIIDEAYVDFSIKNSFVPQLNKYSNLVVLRTLSKAFGLSALRCGFVLSNSNIINVLKKVSAPYPIATPVSDLAIKSLQLENIKCVQKNILQITSNKDLLVKELQSFSCVDHVFPSKTNFILVKFFRSDVIFQHFLLHGIIVRDQSCKIGLSNCVRISIGTINECQDLIKVLRMFKGKKDIR